MFSRRVPAHLLAEMEDAIDSFLVGVEADGAGYEVMIVQMLPPLNVFPSTLRLVGESDEQPIRQEVEDDGA